MYTKGMRSDFLNLYREVKKVKGRFLRFQFPGTYFKPKINAKFPGQLHSAALEQAGQTHTEDGSSLMRFVNMKQSYGNYFEDVDRNVVLDLDCGQALGYNHDVLVNARDTTLYDRFICGRQDASAVPPMDFADLLREEVMPVAPDGTNSIHLADGSITSANELAMSTGIMHYAMQHGKDMDDYKNLCVMGFGSGSHGTSVATLSVSDPEVNVHNLPTYNWPIAPLPSMTYPIAMNEKANQDEEARCLEAARQLIQSRRAEGSEVAAMIIEPIAAFGNQSAMPSYYKKLRKMAKDEGIVFIVDETRCGMGQSGKMWAHEHWWLQEERDGGAPDMVTFGGKAGISGFFSTYDFRLNPFCGQWEQSVDMVQLLNFGLTWKQIQRKNLLELVQDTSSFLKIELGNIERDQKGLIHNIRGNGTMLGFDTRDGELAASMYRWLLKQSIMVNMCSPTTLAVRPALICGPSDAAHLRNAMQAFHVNHDNFE